MSMKKMLAVVAAASLMAAPAFAANPFSDVPMNHWAYDAVEQLSAKGILEGYPNGTFKGNRAMTRYEIATMVARMMANGGVGGADAEKLKALIVEFAPELEALGVKVDGFDARLAKLEKGMGGWVIGGQTRFDFRSHDRKNALDEGKNNGHGFSFQRTRLTLKKELNEGVSFNARWQNNKFDRWWIEAKKFLGNDNLGFRAGAFYVDWEGPDGLYQNNHYWDDDANFLDGTMRGAELSYKRGGFELTGLVGDWGGVDSDMTGKELYGARIKFGGEKFFVSANALFMNGVAGYKGAPSPYAMWGIDLDKFVDNDAQMKVYWLAVGAKPMKGLNLSAAYWMEDISDFGVKDHMGASVPNSVFALAGIDDDPKAWKIVLNVDKSVLKFTGLRAEYGKYDAGFFVQNSSGAMTIGGMDYNNGAGAYFVADTDFLKLSAIQKLSDKFSLYERYAQYKQDDIAGLVQTGKAKELQIGMSYQYTPNLAFTLDYTKFDGQLKYGVVNDKAEDKVVRFRTFLSF